MKPSRLPNTVRLAFTAVLASGAVLEADDRLSGDWAGGFEDGKDYVYLQLHFQEIDGALSATYDAPLLFQRGRALRRVAIDGAAVSFEFPSIPDARRFTGQWKDGTLNGAIRGEFSEAPCRFTRLAPIQPEPYVGTYAMDDGHHVFVRAAVELGLSAFQYIDFTSGRVGVLFPTSPTNFFTGPAVLVPEPVVATATFRLDTEGRATGFDWTGATASKGRRVTLRQKPVAFTNGTVTLSGALILPDAPPPHPVVVCAAGGTAAATRAMFLHIAEFFAIHGIASLIYDKRGLGESTGDWLRAGFGDLAEDVLAGVRMLRTRPDIAPRRIGLFGASQSGWIVALAASRSKDVAFIISQSGPGVSPEEQELFRSEAWLRADGFSEDEILEAMNYIRRRYQCASTGEGWEDLAADERLFRNKRWFAYTGGSVGKDNPFWHFWSLIHDYDPVPDLEKVTCPVLALLGDKDTFLPAEKSARIWRAALENAGNKDATIRIFPNADHSLIESETGGLRETARARRFVPGYFEILRDWTRSRVK